MCRIISRYPRNRRLYDSHAHSYINIDGLYNLIQSGDDFKIIESKTGRDITRKILFEMLARNDEILTIDILKELIFHNNSNFKARLSLMIRRTIKKFSNHKSKHYLIN